MPYFLVTFTVPQALRKIVRGNQRDCYQALFDAGSQTIRELASGSRFIGTDRLGFFGVLPGTDAQRWSGVETSRSIIRTCISSFPAEA